MIDRSHSGSRCFTTVFLRTVKGDLPKGAEGTVSYEMENLGRKLIFVDWDTGIAVPVFPGEIEFVQVEVIEDVQAIDR